MNRHYKSRIKSSNLTTMANIKDKKEIKTDGEVPVNKQDILKQLETCNLEPGITKMILKNLDWSE